MLSKDLERALNESFKQARAQRHEFITVEHLLLALLDDSAAQHVLKACSANIEALRGDLTEFIDATTPLVSGEAEVDTQPTLGFQRVLQRAVFHVQSSGKAEVTGANVLVAIFLGAGKPGGLLPQDARHIAPRCGQFYYSWREQVG